ncbi:hypothetical protein P43SY_001428 [Pythium insidiosum]|uniref:START domain-containing protein n=1 Tax=Pythium insidiosum TaxID=114742 RepID=A0AAD5M6N1_PYTIN|nr:hypothetical protein P43SY_001428 [Pythium insidiosum]
MLGRALKEVKLPFPDDFFPECHVPDRDREVYRRAAASKLRETLAATHFHPARSPEQWKLVGERQGLQLFRERGVAQGSAVSVVGLGALSASLDDVLWGLHAASTAALKTQQLILRGDAFVDAAVLHVDSADDERSSFAGIKWLACAPSGKLMHKRDLCWHELMGSTTDADGQDLGFLVMQSVRIPECPPFEHQGVVRSSASVCYVFRPQASGNVAVFMQGDHVVGGKSRSWSSDSVMVEMWLAIANVLECAQAKRLSRLVRGKDVFFATQTKICEICDQRTGLLKSTDNCKICGKEEEAHADVFHADKLKYINTFSADGAGGLANPSMPRTGAAAAMPDERQRLMERLLQANMTAEATYLLAKYSSNLAQSASGDGR